MGVYIKGVGKEELIDILHYENVFDAIDVSSEFIEVEVKEPQGEWIDMGGYEVCKNCYEVKRFPHWNYCPNCGMKMKGVDYEMFGSY